MRARNILVADCYICNGPLFYDKTIERFGHRHLPADQHTAVPKWVRQFRDSLLPGQQVTKADLISAEALLMLAYMKTWANPCGCGYIYENEAEYANHFILNDPNQLNLGNCPTDKKRSA
jgi:hypothetical protein